MDSVIVASNQFYSHYPKRIPKGTVNAETVQIRLDSEWDGLTVRIHWLNVDSRVEIAPLLERDQPNSIPWEVLTDLGELHMGLVGLDGETVIKPTIWLSYGHVVDGVDPEAGSDPQPPTPSWEQQMVEQAIQANQAAQDAKEYARQVAESIESAGPYAEEAKQAAEAAKASETAAKGSADTATQQAAQAQEAVASIGDAVEQAQQAATDAGAAKTAAETAQGAAAQSAGTAQTAATAASQAAQTAQGASTQAGQYLATVDADAQAAANAATEAGKSQEAAQAAAQQAQQAQQDAQEAVDSIGTAVEQAQQAAADAGAAKTAAETAQDAADQSAGTAQTAAATASQAAQTAQSSATQAGGYLASVDASAQAADTAKVQAQQAATDAGVAKNEAETAARNAEQYAQQALASVLPNSADIPDGYVLKTSGGLPVWAELSGGASQFPPLVNTVDYQEDTPVVEIEILPDLTPYKRAFILMEIHPSQDNTTQTYFLLTDQKSQKLTNSSTWTTSITATQYSWGYLINTGVSIFSVLPKNSVAGSTYFYGDVNAIMYGLDVTRWSGPLILTTNDDTWNFSSGTKIQVFAD